MNRFKMAWEFSAAENGNIALTGEIDLQAGDEFTLAISLGYSYQSAAANLLQSLTTPFDFHHEAYVRQWQRTVVNPKFDFSTETSDDGRTYHLSRCVLLAHEDKIFQGALSAGSGPSHRLKDKRLPFGNFDRGVSRPQPIRGARAPGAAFSAEQRSKKSAP